MNFLHFIFCLSLQVMLFTVSICRDSNCKSNYLNLNHLSTKTPYRFVVNKNDSAYHYPGCQAVRIWSMIRHGTRYPGTKTIIKMQDYLPHLRDKIISSHKMGKGKLCNTEVSTFKQWKPQVDVTEQKFLTHEGEDEMLELAERFQNRFPDLLTEDYSNSTYKFKFTATQRTRESARYFTIGLFGKKVSRYVWFPEAIHKDPVLRFYKLCSKWKVQVDKNPESLYERYQFEKGPEMKVALKQITEHLGLNDTLNVDDAVLMYITCSFETAWNKWKSSPWCYVFSEENLKVFEYAEDLEYYWIDGYGYNLTYVQACPVIRDMLLYLKEGYISDSTQTPSSVLYFSHSGTILKMLAHLGMYKDNTTLTHDVYDRLVDNRNWRTSAIDPFGSNLAFILYQCEKEEKVLSLHQEKPVILPGCPKTDLCPLKTLLKLYDKSINSCNFDEMCSITPK